MQTSFRDNAIGRNRLLFKLTLLWAMSSTLAVIVLACLCFYVVGHQQTHWLPVCTSADFSIGSTLNRAPQFSAKSNYASDFLDCVNWVWCHFL